MPKAKQGLPQVKVETVNVARCISENGVTFFATFNETNKTCGVTIGSSHAIDHDASVDFVVSFRSLRAFAKLLLKHAKGD